MLWAVRVCSLCRTGRRDANRHPTLRPISSSGGEGKNSKMAVSCVCDYPRMEESVHLGQLPLNKRSFNAGGQACDVKK
jgi:hypothetical protein